MTKSPNCGSLLRALRAWISAGELVERGVVRQFVPRVIPRIATQASAEVVEKWAGRVIPVLSSVIGGALNYFFIRAWSEREQNTSGKNT